MGGVGLPRFGQAWRDLDLVGVVLVLDQTFVGVDHDRGAVVGVIDVGVGRLPDVAEQTDGQGAVGRWAGRPTAAPGLAGGAGTTRAKAQGQRGADGEAAQQSGVHSRLLFSVDGWRERQRGAGALHSAVTLGSASACSRSTTTLDTTEMAPSTNVTPAIAGKSETGIE